eukprot:SAG11_NODE_5012_length_1692_cov_1.664156_1_plen_153_part_00
METSTKPLNTMETPGIAPISTPSASRWQSQPHGIPPHFRSIPTFIVTALHKDNDSSDDWVAGLRGDATEPATCARGIPCHPQVPLLAPTSYTSGIVIKAHAHFRSIYYDGGFNIILVRGWMTTNQRATCRPNCFLRCSSLAQCLQPIPCGSS